MRLRLERLRPGETDYEIVGLMVGGATAVVAAVWLWLALPTPVCLFHALTGQPCLTCGGTRCLRALLAGHAGAALAWNPLVFAAVAAAAAFGLYAAVVTAFRLPRLRIESVSPREAAGLRAGLAIVAAANWIYLIVRFSRGF